MSQPVAERFRWAVEVLDPAPSDRLLEIGCGPGVAVSLICRRLSGGTIVAIDRSRPMIDRAVRRNARCVEAGKASFEAVALGDADFLRTRFDTAFAINVRLFRTNARQELDVLRRALKPTGALYLFQHHPSAGRTRAVTRELRAAADHRRVRGPPGVVEGVRRFDDDVHRGPAAGPVHVRWVDFFHGRARKVMDCLSSGPRISNT